MENIGLKMFDIIHRQIKHHDAPIVFLNLEFFTHISDTGFWSRYTPNLFFRYEILLDNISFSFFLTTALIGLTLISDIF
jgi:hypothetical protein